MKRVKFMLGITIVVLSVLALVSFSLAMEAWEDMTGEIKELDLEAVAVDPTDSDIVFVSASNRLYKSVDGGENWEDVFTVYGNGKVNFITVDKRSPKTVYIATSNGLFRTMNKGDGWRRVFKGIGDKEKKAKSFAIHPFDSDVIYAGAEKGLFISKDSGKSWDKFSSGIGNVAVDFIIADPNRPGTLYIATTKGVFKINSITEH